jgi:hypothetical protein
VELVRDTNCLMDWRRGSPGDFVDVVGVGVGGADASIGVVLLDAEAATTSEDDS